jgi:hypothetical protein
MTLDEHNKLQGLRKSLKGSGLFCFEKSGRFFLYREADIKGERNTLVVSADKIDDFVTRAVKHAPSR